VQNFAMRGPVRVSGLSLVLMAASACGSGPGASDLTLLPSTRWGGEYAAALCAKVFGCCDASELAATWKYADEAQCRQMAGTEIQMNLSELLALGCFPDDAVAALDPQDAEAPPRRRGGAIVQELG